MNRKEAYQKAMNESLMNSEMWLKESELIARKGSKGHSQALLIFASEELGKAVMCWLTVKGVFPFNHAVLDFRPRKSLLHNHNLKSAIAIGLSLVLSGLKADHPEQTIPDPSSGEPIKISTFIAGLGAKATLDRLSWMYVDITQESKGQFSVQSPLENDPVSLKDAIKDLNQSIERFRGILHMDEEAPEKLKATFSKLRNQLKERI